MIIKSSVRDILAADLAGRDRKEPVLFCPPGWPEIRNFLSCQFRDIGEIANLRRDRISYF
jgi:hypothetical protein